MNLKTVTCLIVVDNYKEEAKIVCMLLMSINLLMCSLCRIWKFLMMAT